MKRGGGREHSSTGRHSVYREGRSGWWDQARGGKGRAAVAVKCMAVVCSEALQEVQCMQQPTKTKRTRTSVKN